MLKSSHHNPYRWWRIRKQTVRGPHGSSKITQRKKSIAKKRPYWNSVGRPPLRTRNPARTFLCWLTYLQYYHTYGLPWSAMCVCLCLPYLCWRGKRSMSWRLSGHQVIEFIIKADSWKYKSAPLAGPTVWSVLFALSFLLYGVGYNLGVGPVAYFIPGELVMPEAASVALGAAVAVNWFSTLITTMVYYPLNVAIGGWSYLLFAVPRWSFSYSYYPLNIYQFFVQIAETFYNIKHGVDW